VVSPTYQLKRLAVCFWKDLKNFGNPYRISDSFRKGPTWRVHGYGDPRAFPGLADPRAWGLDDLARHNMQQHNLPHPMDSMVCVVLAERIAVDEMTLGTGVPGVSP
jgi:hypothetical protein